MNKKKCILCNKGEVKKFVNLGHSALANNLISLKDFNTLCIICVECSIPIFTAFGLISFDV